MAPGNRCPQCGAELPADAPGTQVVVAECITISFTFDHRYADGAQGAQLMRLFTKIFGAPSRFAHRF